MLVTFSLTSTTPGALAGLTLVSADFSVPLFYSLAGDTITVGGEDSFFTAARRNSTPRSTSRAVPEAATWALMLLGFGAIGVALRRSRKELALAA